jgi:two-component system phosphate regulon response regulator OmpR
MSDRPVRFGPFQLDLSHRLLKKGDSTVPLTTGDFALLSALVRNPGQPMSRDQLKAVISKREYTADDRSVDVRIARLRRLLESDVATPRYLQTVWGFGYVMVPGN